MIVTVTRNPDDLAAIRRSGMRTAAAASLTEGLDAASRSAARLLVFDLGTGRAPGSPLRHCLQSAPIPCPVLLRHDMGPDTISALYGVAQLDADIRPSFRRYDDLEDRLRTAPRQNDMNATWAILRELSRIVDPRMREFVGVMTILGERRVLQSLLVAALGSSRSSFRKWLAEERSDAGRLPSYPTLNAHFVALHWLWRRERLRWTAKRASASAGFTEEKACANYLRYHVGRTGTQLLREGGFDARMTATAQIFGTPRAIRRGREMLWRI
ncbi:MAG TPA: hypothetical protein VFO55_14255 [Gemmatimonadaceae bacterium]|nr:hypothetical protein [Gemmatimonadaceae bacterium]